ELTVIDADELIDLEWKYTIRCLIVRDGVAIEKYFYIDPKIRIKRSSAILGRDDHEGDLTPVEQAFDAWLANNGGAQASDTCGEVTWSNDFTGFTDDCGETGSATVTFTATDACGLTASTTATFTIEPEALEVRGPDDVDAAACEYDDQEALSAAYNAWLAEFELVQAGCDGAGDFTTTPPTTVDYELGANITLTYSATDGCNTDSATASFVIVPGPEPVVTNAEICEGQSYFWPVNQQTYTSAQNLIVEGDGCEPDQILNLELNPPITITRERRHVWCYGEATGYFDITISGGDGDYTVLWTGPNGFTSTDEDIYDLYAGDYVLTITDGQGCTATFDKRIQQPEELLACEINIDSNSSRGGCQDDVTATVSVTGGYAPYTYLWDNDETTATAYDLDGGVHEVLITDDRGCTTVCSVTIPEPCDDVQIVAKMYLQGPYNLQTGLMNDNLRSMDIIPTTSPYSDNATVVPEVFNSGGISGNGQEADDIVDWVWIELRQEGANNVAYKGQSALLQRDGDVVDLDGVSAVTIAAAPDNYYVVVNHRIHLGAMSGNPIPLSGVATTVDFTNSSFTTYGTNAQLTESTGKKVLWVGDVMSNGLARYLGPNNDTNMIKDHVLDQPGNTSGSNYYPFNGYDSADLNMDGQVRYMGSGNDSVLLKDCILMHPGNASSNNFYPIVEQIPN
ncbi:MAG: hypothetical protein HKO72_02095, partial [Flavobacteriaceae bacterium]|nr:hypothetical protein [Flavobacteriaceae bacterium]